MTAKRRKQNNASVAAKINFQLKTIVPLTPNQERAFRDRDYNQVLYGSAGTGKTFLGLYFALDDVVNHNQFQKISIFRSAVPSRDMGFMPGNDKEKAKLFEEPYEAICTELFNRGDAYGYLKGRGLIEFKTTSYVRGITLDNAVVIIDEFQNMTAHELHSVITRVGKDCRIVVSGDCTQDDLQQRKERSGAADFLKIVKTMDSFRLTELGHPDIVRSSFVKEYIIARDNLERRDLVLPL